MNKFRLLSVVLLLSSSSIAQIKTQAPESDKKQIDKLCGCFLVDFQYAETFSPDPNYKFHEREHSGGVPELALPIEKTDRKTVIQHLLVVAPGMIVKHWREEWTYENPYVWRYLGDRTWVKDSLPYDQVKGKWTQTVWEVGDDPRYQGFSQFVNLDGKVIWQNTTDAPLPRREYSVRSDYNILKRTNRLNITDTGYLHEQDNKKIVRTNGNDQLIAEEKGLNSYVKVEAKECETAIKYWKENEAFWEKVRAIWSNYINTHNKIHLKNKINDKFLHEYLLDLAKEYSKNKISDPEITQKIQTQINSFIIP